MNPVLEPTDIATVPAEVMQTALSAVVRSGRAMILFEGAGDADRKAVEEAFWNTYEGDTTSGGMALIRLWNLVEVLQARRLQDQIMQRGFRFIESAAIAAGDLRLNLDWGFMPQRLFWAIKAVDEARAARTSAPVRLKTLELAVLPAAA